MVVNTQDSLLPISFAKFARFFCLLGLHVLYLYGGNINNVLLCISAQIHVYWCPFDRLKSAMVGVFTPGNKWSYFHKVDCLINIYQHAIGSTNI